MKHSVNWPEFLQGLRAPYPVDELVWIIQDGPSTHRTAAVRQWATEHRVILIPSPTNASWLNPVECHAGDIQRLALPETQFTSVEEVRYALDRAVAYRNEEFARRGKRFRDAVRKDRRRKSKIPTWRQSIRNQVH